MYESPCFCSTPKFSFTVAIALGCLVESHHVQHGSRCSTGFWVEIPVGSRYWSPQSEFNRLRKLNTSMVNSIACGYARGTKVSATEFMQ